MFPNGAAVIPETASRPETNFIAGPGRLRPGRRPNATAAKLVRQGRLATAAFVAPPDSAAGATE